MHFWALVSMLTLCAFFFSAYLGEKLTDFIRVKYAQYDRERRNER